MEISKKAKISNFSPMRKFHERSVAAKKRGVKVYHLNIGQPNLDTPSEYFAAIKKFSANNDYYAPSRGIDELLDAIQKYYKNFLSVNLTHDDILITTGGSEAIFMAAFSILNDGDEVLIPEPFYPNYSTIINSVGGKVVPIATSVDEDYNYSNTAKIKKLLTKRTKAMLITVPNNPTGSLLSDNELLSILEFCKKNQIYLICDEVYRELCFDDKKHSSVLTFKGFEENVIVIDSLSKRFSACGARIGAIISRNHDIIQNSLKYAQARLSVSTLNQIGAATLFDNISTEYIEKIKTQYKKRRDVVIDGLKKIKGVQVAVPKGAFYIMASLPVDDSDKFQYWLLDEFADKNETIMFAPGGCFYATEGKGKNEVRLACVLEEKELMRAVELLSIALEKYNSK